MAESNSSDGLARSTDAFVLRPDRDRMEALAEFAAGAGHEINNPLATIIGRAQLLLKDEQDPQRRQMLASIGAQAYRVRDMIGDAMLFGRPPLPELSDVPLANFLEQMVDKQTVEFSAERCSIQIEINPKIALRADRVQLSIVLAELIRNSRQALRPAGGVIQVRAQASGDQATIEITDQGKGFTEIERRHAFDPFFSGRQAGRGLGFGLSKCWRIIDQHQGQIELESSAAGPTTVRFTWPLAATTGRSTSVDSNAPRQSGND